ncbi:MAG: hypothetical protein MUF60_01965 [Vicinamibacterales bacterium]|jgi:hypothetical protein|nr:hypothetical protein [Vicinamibacterales bacterium]
MKSRGVRVLLMLVAVAAMAAAGAGVWQLEQRLADARVAADAFERDARHAVVSIGEWRAAQQAYVAEGQPSQAWMTKATAIADAIGPRLSALRAAARTAEAQGSLESAAEAFTALLQSDARARDYATAGQLLSASDVIFVEAAPAIDKAVIGIDTARGQESVAHAVAIEALRRWEITALGAAAGVVLIVVLLLVPLPRAPEASSEGGSAGDEIVIPKGAGLQIPQDLNDGVVSRAKPTGGPAPKVESLGAVDAALDAAATPKGPDLDAVAGLCSALARVQDTRELPGLLERIAKALDATGVIVWMPGGPQGTLRPVLTHGYAPLALSRMGVIHPAADNATATAYRTKSVLVVPSDVLASGAVVAPLMSAEGCSGAMAVELREGVEPTPQVKAVATILAAQLATMFTPGSVVSQAQPAPAGAAAGRGSAAERT